MALDENFSSSKWKYHVFLSFRGVDTRLSFTDHLYAALERKCIITFMDDEELVRGEGISQNLFDAIEESLSAIVIISQNYASSTWCLDELQKIVDRKQKFGLEVFPIFYGVDPSDVRNQRGSFAEAFKNHEQSFIENKEKVQKWRDALKDVASLAGWDSKNRHETKLIEEIVEQVWTKLEPKLPTYSDGLVAIEAKVEEMYSHLKFELQDVCFIGIWGMGGIGKTTLATVVFKKIKSQFDVTCFLANVGEASKEGDQGLVHLQNKLLSHFKSKSMIIDTSSQGKDSIRNLLHNKKVLLVLDDVSAKSQLENLAGSQEWFGPGSRIIVTTRDKHLLISYGLLFDIYEIKILNAHESLRLFSEKAFKGDQPKKDYLELSKKVVEYTGGLPLALEVLGSFLCGRSVQEWEEALIKMRQVPNGDILKKLRISYDMLGDEQKTIFLYIACFFKGWYKDRVTVILDNCGLHPTIGINVLIEKSLVTPRGAFLGMHDLLEEMGKNIVFQESPHDPGRCRCLWSLEDIDQVLSKNTGTENVQGIVLKRPTESYDLHWHPKAFSKMCNIRFLIIHCDLHLQLGLKCLSSSLKVLIWKGYPLKALPLGVQLDELVYLQMWNSKVEKLWNRTQFFRKLKLIDLTDSEDLLQSPNISGVPNLEALILDGCINLVKVHQSVGQHKKLETLSLIGCLNLETLPSKMEMCSLKRLILFGCIKVTRLPDFGENMECVSTLNLGNCENLLCLTSTITNLKSLKTLNVSGCLKVDRLPDNINENKALEDLDLSRTSIREVNSSLFCLDNLQRLSLRGCSGPIFKSRGKSLPFWWKHRWNRDQIVTSKSLVLPRFISTLSSLTNLDLSYCNLKLLPEDLCNLPSLERLILSGNIDLTLDLASIANLPKLRCLEFGGAMRGSRTLLSPHVRIYSDDFAAKAGLVDQGKLWRLFDSCHDKIYLKDSLPYCVYEIPLSVENQTFFSTVPHLSKDDSSASISNDCGLGEWWGIAVFVALDPPVSSAMPFIRLYWRIIPPNPESCRSLRLITTTRTYSNQYLITMIMNDNYIYTQIHQRGYHNNDESKFCFPYWKPEFIENTKLHVRVEVDKRTIRLCGWHVLCKEDFIFEALPESSTSKDLSFSNNSTYEFEGDVIESNVLDDIDSRTQLSVVSQSD